MSLDNTILQAFGGVQNNSLPNVLNVYDENDNNNELHVINHSPYYDNDMLVNHLQNEQNKFNILSTNIESILAKFNEFEIFIGELRKKNIVILCNMSTGDLVTK